MLICKQFLYFLLLIYKFRINPTKLISPGISIIQKKVNVERFTLLSLEISPTKLYIVKHLLYLVPVHAH